MRTTVLTSRSSALLCFTLLLLSSLNALAANGVVAAIQQKYVITEVSANHDQITKDGTPMSLKSAGVYSLPTAGIGPTPITRGATPAVA